MGQKINPNIFRLGVNKKWKTEFFEKKPKEFADFTGTDLEIQAYLERFLYIHSLFLHSYKIHYSSLITNIYISYAIISKLKKSKIKRKKVKIINENYKDSLYISDKKRITEKNKLLLKAGKYLKQKNNPNDFLQYSLENKIKKMMEVLLLFRNKKIIINFNCINKVISLTVKQKKELKKKFILLHKFKNSTFFKEGVNLIFISIFKTNSSKLLSSFIASQLKKIKKQKFFMAFLKKTLTLFIYSELSTVKGVKIKIKGRLNGLPRAKHKIINVGKLPVQTINSPLCYSESEIHNSTGSFGVKVWIINKN